MKKNHDLSQALLTIQHQYPEETAIIRKHLEAVKTSKDNLLILSMALMNIRSKAQRLKQSSNLEAGLRSELQHIEAIADSLHNVGSMMAKGVACNALNLYRQGRFSDWPTGFSHEVTSAVYLPNPHVDSSDCLDAFEMTEREEKLIAGISASSSRKYYPTTAGNN